MRSVDLVLFSGAVYGLSWIISCSKLFAPVRRWLRPVPFIGELVQCIACVAVWAGVGFALLLDHATLLSPSALPQTTLDVLLLGSWSVAAVWIAARLLGDAD